MTPINGAGEFISCQNMSCRQHPPPSLVGTSLIAAYALKAWPVSHPTPLPNQQHFAAGTEDTMAPDP